MRTVTAFTWRVAVLCMLLTTSAPAQGQGQTLDELLMQQIERMREMSPDSLAMSVRVSGLFVTGSENVWQPSITAEMLERYLDTFEGRFSTDDGQDLDESARILARDFLEQAHQTIRGLQRELMTLEETAQKRARSEAEEIHQRLDDLLKSAGPTNAEQIRAVFNLANELSTVLGRSNESLRGPVFELAERIRRVDEELLADWRSLLPTEIAQEEWPFFVAWVNRTRYLNPRYIGLINAVAYARIDLIELLTDLELTEEDIVDRAALDQTLQRYAMDLDAAVLNYIEISRKNLRHGRGSSTPEEMQSANRRRLAEVEAEERVGRIARSSAAAIAALLDGPARERFEMEHLDRRAGEGVGQTMAMRVYDHVMAYDDLTDDQRDAIDPLYERYLADHRRVRNQVRLAYEERLRHAPISAMLRAMIDNDQEELNRIRAEMEARHPRGDELNELTRRFVGQIRRQLTAEQIERLPRLPPGW